MTGYPWPATLSLFGKPLIHPMHRWLLIVFLSSAIAAPVRAQLETLETENLRLVYFGASNEYLVRHLARSFENSLATHQRLFDYRPSEKVTLFLHDWSDFGNAGADVLPRNRMTVGMAPLSYVFETSPANERMNSTMHHELMHIVANDQPGARDRLFRRVFRGKVAPRVEEPLSIIYSYLTAPRRYAPRWYHEGIAVFMETWMAGGLGRSLGGYDEMVFRTLVLENGRLYDPVGLEAEAKEIDFQAGVNSYLYGTRFMGYLALQYGPEAVLRWVERSDGTRGHFTTQFKRVFGVSLDRAWDDWLQAERVFQQENITRVRRHPITRDRPLSRRALGSVSRLHYSPRDGVVYGALNYPGQIAHIAAIDESQGTISRITDVKGASLYSVSSLALDDDGRTLFYTTDNNDHRDLRAVDLTTGSTRMLIRDARIGDLAFNSADRSLWGVRHFLGISTIVRIPPPYTEWQSVSTWPYGKDVYDLDVSPDGQHLTASLAEISGRQKLIRMNVDQLLVGDDDIETLFDFGTSNPESFAHSHDGRYLYGSSYYSGVSNVYRYDLEAEEMSVMTNAETGYFRPAGISSDSLIALRFTSGGFLPVMLKNEPVSNVGAIDFLGQRIVTTHPVVTEWKAASPRSIDLDSLTTYAGPYRGLRRLQPVSAIPVVQGYKDAAAVGLRVDMLDDVGLHALGLSLSYTPSAVLPAGERLHAAAEYTHLQWTLRGGYNAADFYDLFGPTKTSRKGYYLGVSFEDFLINDRPRRLSYRAGLTGYGGLERLPDYQNVAASYSEMLTASSSLTYENLRASIGAVDYEKGHRAGVSASVNYVNGRAYPRIYGDYQVGLPLPLSHSSLWLRTYAGQSVGSRSNPFANFFFGGFGNNYVDHQAIKRYHSHYSFPGLEINEIGGTNFLRMTGEWVLPPVRFRRAGGSSLYLKWARLSAFSSALATNVDEPDQRRLAGNIGAQLDLRIVLFSYISTTLSGGYALAAQDGGGRSDEVMFSLRLF